MELLEALTPDVTEVLFPRPLPGEATISQVAIVTDAVHFVGITLSLDVRFVVAFLRAEDQAAGDAAFMAEMASTWTTFQAGRQLDPGARIIKFFRAEATDDVFDPTRWALPRPFTIWQLQEALTQTLQLYTQALPEVRQLFYMPQTEALERWYARMEKRLCGPRPIGLAFQVIAKPAVGEGGFHGYERV
ncbi:hypothetical protein [Stenotrophomonas acidaminiphila]|uniref:hypothetical protein n=1 Tax=Stenotrophomonas acidaminiphila TaxID=128780 RepID=UPI0028AD4E00|nr:hypothetical protein [Stenotrophomonas acidaminiphila]